MQKLEARINSVTVYTDRAMIKKNAKINVEKGEHTFIFENLPYGIEKNSIQINGTHGLILSDIKFEQKYIEELPESDKKSLLLNKKNIEEILKEINDKINQTTKEKEFVEGIIKKIIETETGENFQTELDPEKWMKMVVFYRTKIEALDKEFRETNKERVKTEEQLIAINHSLKLYEAPEYKINNCVVVKIESLEAGEKEIQLNYIVYGPSWQPIYDLRVNSETKKLGLEYNALVIQNTNEDWDEVKLLLSTAKAQVSGSQPELNPWHINFYTPPPMAMPSVKTEFKKAKGAMSLLSVNDTKYKERKEEGSIDDFVDLDAMKKPEAQVEAGATSVVFAISGKNTIKSTGEKYKVVIYIKEFNAEFKYSSVPKLSPYFYLKAKVKNESEFPLLAGETHIFLDGSFVANSRISLVSPDEEFWTSLGVDEGMKIDYKLLRKYEKDEGIFSKKRKIIFEYKTEITNTKKTEEEINIQDQIPISNNQDIVVELIEPKYKEDTSEIKKDELQKITWTNKIQPNEKKIIYFKFSVESPRDKIVYGI